MNKFRDQVIQSQHKQKNQFQINFNQSKSSSALRLQFDKGHGLRIVVPRSRETHGRFSQKNNNVQSMNVSRHFIQEDHHHQVENIQFRKTPKTSSKLNNHIRTKSTQIYKIDEQISNFSNSLKNISQQIIEIPSKNRKYVNNNIQCIGKENDTGVINFSKRRGSHKSTQKKQEKRKKNSSLDFNSNSNSNSNRHSKKNSVLKQSLSQFRTTNKKDKKELTFIPKPRKHTKNIIVQNPSKTSLSQFSLKALKITQNGSIIYLALHKLSRCIYTIKSIRKTSIKNRLQNIIMQIKLGLFFNHPNYTQIYGFFSDNDNFYIIKEYLQEGSVIDHKKQICQNVVGQSLNQILFAFRCLGDFVDIGSLYVNPSQISKSYGIAKITNICFRDNNKRCENEEKLRQTIQWFFEQEDRRSTLEGTFITNYSKTNSICFSNKNTTSFLQQLSSTQHFSQSQISQLLQHPFLRQIRFKSTMQQ